MIGKIFDIFTVGFILLLGVAALHFRKSIVLRSRGYLLFGIGSSLIALSLLLFKFGISLYAFFIVIAFIVVQIGNVILMTKEKHIYEVYRRQPGLFKRLLSGFYPRRDVIETEAGKGFKPKKTDGRQAMLTGLFLVLAGIGVFFWRKEIIYPAFLVVTGIFFIIAGKLYSVRVQKKPN